MDSRDVLPAFFECYEQDGDDPVTKIPVTRVRGFMTRIVLVDEASSLPVTTRNNEATVMPFEQ